MGNTMPQSFYAMTGLTAKASQPATANHVLTGPFSEPLPTCLYRAAQVRELDRLTIETHGVAGFTLMHRAARAALDILLEVYPVPGLLTIVCGPGNNGGDGYLMASLAKQQGVDVQIIQFGDVSKCSDDARLARSEAEQAGVLLLPFDPRQTLDGGVVVDALLGTGLSGVVRDDYAAVIAWINSHDLPVVAVDIPSGLCSDSGAVLGCAVSADVTVSFIGLKRGLLTGLGPNHCGALLFDDLAVPSAIYDEVPTDIVKLNLADTLQALPARRRCDHKGHFGHVLVVGGDYGMAGAPVMAAEAAARVGAGLVACATRQEHVAALIARCPEVMAQGVVSGQELELLLVRPSVLVVGPGLGRGSWGEQLLQQAYYSDKPMVVDADALTILSEGRVIKNPYRDNWILTPHPAEAARLLGCDTATVQADRFTAVKTLQQRFGGAVVLKGAGTLIADAGSEIALCSDGNPGMATGGMGDVLSGVLGALMAQGLGVGEAARLGVGLHARAGDLAAIAGQRGTQATDLIPLLRQLVNGLLVDGVLLKEDSIVV